MNTSPSPFAWVRRAVVAGLALLLVGAAPTRAAPLKIEALDIRTPRGVFHFKVEVADTDESRETGLMFRSKLAADRGMLFDFKVAAPVSFWMKNTVIPLDLVFIAADGHIASIAREATPRSLAPIPSGGPVLGVLELRGGRAGEIGARPGDKVRHRIFAH